MSNHTLPTSYFRRRGNPLPICKRFFARHARVFNTGESTVFYARYPKLVQHTAATCRRRVCAYISTYIYTHIYIYVCMYKCVYMCVCIVYMCMCIYVICIYTYMDSTGGVSSPSAMKLSVQRQGLGYQGLRNACGQHARFIARRGASFALDGGLVLTAKEREIERDIQRYRER